MTTSMGRVVNGRITLVDVSREAGVSRSTVSLVLNGNSSIPESTSLRVRQAMADLGYVYNRQAANLRTQRSMTIGLIATEIANPYFAEIAMALEDRVTSSGYTLLVGYTRDDVGRQDQLIATFLERGVDGIVLLPAIGTDLSELAVRLRPLGLPLVLIARQEVPQLSFVGTDNRRAGGMLGEHLAQLGVRSVAFLGGHTGNLSFADRVAGIADAFDRAGVELTLSVFEGAANAAEGVVLARRLMDSGRMLDAIVAFSDVVVGGVYSELHARGVRPGADVAVAGFDDVHATIFNNPPLTSVATFPDKIGARSAAAVLAAIEARRDSSVQATAVDRALVEPVLRIRASTIMWRPRTGDRVDSGATPRTEETERNGEIS